MRINELIENEEREPPDNLNPWDILNRWAVNNVLGKAGFNKNKTWSLGKEYPEVPKTEKDLENYFRNTLTIEKYPRLKKHLESLIDYWGSKYHDPAVTMIGVNDWIYRLASTKLDILNRDSKTENSILESKKKQTKYVYRIDSKKITNFDKALKKYHHTPDWKVSGITNKDNDKWFDKQGIDYEVSQGLFAGSLKHVAPYATGNAIQTRYIIYNDSGKDYVVFDERDQEKFKNRKTYLSVFDAKDFQKTAGKEYFSSNPGPPLKQIVINDPFDFIRKQGLHIRFVPNLNKFYQDNKDKLNVTGREGL